MSTHWTIDGADGEPILGDTHTPSGAPRGVMIVAHGFKGYKDYGMFPFLAASFAGMGLIAHRFNFSHSGMTNEIDTFARPELFVRDTWNRQVVDLRAMLDAVADGTLEGAGLPVFVFGHSRGGASTLLTAGRHAPLAVAGLITAAAPSACNRFSDEVAELMRTQGYVSSPSSRTGQDLHVGREWLDEQDADPARHDLLALCARIECPVLVVHGADDPTVPENDGHEIIGAIGANARLHVIAGANHVFNVANPMEGAPSAELTELVSACGGFVDDALSS